MKVVSPPSAASRGGLSDAADGECGGCVHDPAQRAQTILLLDAQAIADLLFDIEDAVGTPRGSAEDGRGVGGGAREHYASALELARIYAALQDREATLTWLTIAGHNREGSARGLRNEEDFAFLHSDPRFQELVRD